MEQLLPVAVPGTVLYLQGNACVWVLVKQPREQVTQVWTDGHILRELQRLGGNSLTAAQQHTTRAESTSHQHRLASSPQKNRATAGHMSQEW